MAAYMTARSKEKERLVIVPATCSARNALLSRARALNFSNIKVFFIVSDKGELEVLLYLFYTIIFSTIAQAYFLHLRAFRDANNATSLIFV